MKGNESEKMNSPGKTVRETKGAVGFGCSKEQLAANVIRRTRYNAGGLIYCQRQSSGQRPRETLGFEGLTSRW
jgi:hypothetical protein